MPNVIYTIQLMMQRSFYWVFIFFIYSSCGHEGRLNIFQLEDDKKLGAQLNTYIESDSSGIIILDTAQYAVAYSHLERVKNHILNSGKLKHRNDFEWKARVIQNDTILNAFATPGGYIYVYTGLIKYLDTEDQFAGVLAHEIAHADQRHSTAMLTKVYGITFLMNIILGNDSRMVSDLTQNLLSLSFSRGAEEDADKHSVIYLCTENSPYKPDGAAGFFEKMTKEEQRGGIPEFLSTHPNPPNRINSIREKAKELNCQSTPIDPTLYKDFKNSLP